VITSLSTPSKFISGMRQNIPSRFRNYLHIYFFLSVKYFAIAALSPGIRKFHVKPHEYVFGIIIYTGWTSHDKVGLAISNFFITQIHYALEIKQ